MKSVLPFPPEKRDNKKIEEIGQGFFLKIVLYLGYIGKEGEITLEKWDIYLGKVGKLPWKRGEITLEKLTNYIGKEGEITLEKWKNFLGKWENYL